MKFGKKTPAHTMPNPNAQQRSINLTILPCLACLLLPLLASLITYMSVNSSSTTRLNDIAQQQANAVMKNFEQTLEYYQAQANALGRSPHISTLAESKNRKSIDDYAKKLSDSLPNAIGLTIIPRGKVRTDKSTYPPINFAALDMLKAAERGNFSFPEVHMIEKKQVLRIAAPVYEYSNLTTIENREIIGSLILSYPLDAVIKRLFPPETTAGTLKIEQKFTGSTALEIYTNGNLFGDNLGEAVATSKVPYFKTYFTLSSTFSEEHFSGGFFWGVHLIAALAALAAALTSYFLLKGQVNKDLLALEGHFKQITVGKGNKQPSYHIDSFNDTSRRLLDLIDALVAMQHSRSSKGAQSPAAGKRPQTEKAVNSDIDLVGLQHNEDELFGFSEDGGSTDDMNIVSQANIEAVAEPGTALPKSIFRAYDIRGVVGKTLTPDIVFQIGRAIGSETLAQGQSGLTVGRDGRLSGEQLMDSLIKGILSTGCNAINIGMAPTPTLYFAAHELKTKSGVMVTGSHNPPDYNGLKIVINGTTLANESIQQLYQRIMNNDLASGKGQLEERPVSQEYIDKIVEDVILARPIKVVIDCGNGVAGAVAPDLLAHLGCQVIPLYCDVDGNFPNHHPDPSQPKNLVTLIEAVKKHEAELGIAFDGDGDRIGIVSASGKIIYSDRLLMLFAKDLLSRNPGADIIFDIKCTRDLVDLISGLGGRPIMWKTGHSLIKAKLKETGAVLAGEMSGHIFFNDRWYGFDDALYSAARLLEIISMESATTDELFDEFPIKESTPELNIPVPEEKKFEIVEKLKNTGSFGNGKITDIDGIRVDYSDSWGLLRASNTTPMLVARFEGDTPDALDKVKSTFKNNLQKVDRSLQIPF